MKFYREYLLQKKMTMILSRKKGNAQIFLYLHNQKELSGCSFHH